MFEHILVPLDGSGLAEDVLGAVESIAETFGARVTLLHVLERAAPSSVHGERHITDAIDAASYLEEVAERLRSAAVETDAHVHDRQVTDVAAAIDLHAHELGVDLVAMCKHGHSGLRQVLIGSIPQQILRGGSTPMLLRTPVEGAADGRVEFNSILVPLELHHDASGVLEIGATLARRYGGRVHLFTAVPRLAGARRASASARLLPGATAESLRMEEEEAAEYLTRQARRLQAAGVEATVELSHDDPATAILEQASTVGANLVVLTTHARAGFEAWYTGSTGERLIAAASPTLLLLREL